MMNKSVAPLLKTLLFTVVVPGTVAVYVPWALRRNAVPVGGAQEWAATGLIVAGIAIYLSTAFWGFAVIGGGTPAPIAPTKTLVVCGLHHYIRNCSLLADKRGSSIRVPLRPTCFAWD